MATERTGPALETAEGALFTVAPGDTLVVHVDRFLARDEITRYSDEIRAQMPDDVKVLILHNGLRLEGVVAPWRYPGTEGHRAG